MWHSFINIVETFLDCPASSMVSADGLPDCRSIRKDNEREQEGNERELAHTHIKDVEFFLTMFLRNIVNRVSVGDRHAL